MLCAKLSTATGSCLTRPVPRCIFECAEIEMNKVQYEPSPVEILPGGELTLEELIEGAKNAPTKKVSEM